jgi:predicted DNA-binding transcriptional regulator AlpA
MTITETKRHRAKPPVGTGSRPPTWMSRKELAWELSCGDSHIDVLVDRGTIPPPTKLSNGCVRWHWPSVDEALARLNWQGNAASDDPYLAGVANAVA